MQVALRVMMNISGIWQSINCMVLAVVLQPLAAALRRAVLPRVLLQPVNQVLLPAKQVLLPARAVLLQKKQAINKK